MMTEMDQVRQVMKAAEKLKAAAERLSHEGKQEKSDKLYQEFAHVKEMMQAGLKWSLTNKH
ncbi:hypothetical protein FLK61_31830 [Paenalkalicoccus suaedae]|uniref:Uncharacterized protein n=1 Tax=Paenalkalicoccus suaedae TaxID=2592382 RepID=A0A859FEF1_9BACI|nr:hypothetical protein [Paenalkalicoccus suaedae]QKS71301.1 hypothetical protein FLK61_31830 [Paenalkalicoccus suaedae]